MEVCRSAKEEVGDRQRRWWHEEGLCVRGREVRHRNAVTIHGMKTEETTKYTKHTKVEVQ
jgi:hypothetical protein